MTRAHLPADADDRTRELAAGLERTQQRIDEACRAVGRDPQEVTLVVVTKFFGAQDVARLARLGVRDVGENRDQEASAKSREWVQHLPAEDQPMADRVRWHFIGQVQSRKAGSVASYADLVHSVDRLKLVGALDRAAEREGRALGVCVQVDLAPALADGGEPASGAGQTDPGAAPRGGVDPRGVLDLCEQVEAAAHLRLAGLMTVAPPEADPGEAFAVLADLHRAVLERHPGATMLSAGMSGDLEAAVAAGATHVRVGSAIMGSRPALG